MDEPAPFEQRPRASRAQKRAEQERQARLRAAQEAAVQASRARPGAGGGAPGQPPGATAAVAGPSHTPHPTVPGPLHPPARVREDESPIMLTYGGPVPATTPPPGWRPGAPAADAWAGTPAPGVPVAAKPPLETTSSAHTQMPHTQMPPAQPPTQQPRASETATAPSEAAGRGPGRRSLRAPGEPAELPAVAPDLVSEGAAPGRRTLREPHTLEQMTDAVETPAEPPTRGERSAARRAARREAREEFAAARAAGEAPDETRTQQALLAGATLFTVLALCVLISGAPVLGHGWQTSTLATGAAMVVLAGLGLAPAVRVVGSRTRVIAAVLAGVLVISFAWGAATSVVIDGKVHLNTSDTAQAYHLSLELRADLARMSALDPLLTYNQADARLHYSKYAPARRELLDIYAKYDRYTQQDLPSAQFATVIEHLKAAANFGALALEGKAKLVVEEDARLAANVLNQRATFANEVLTAGRILPQVATLYGIELTQSDERGPRE